MKLDDLRINHCLFMMCKIGLTEKQANSNWKSMLTIKRYQSLKINDGSFADKLFQIRKNWLEAKRTKAVNEYVKWD